MTTATVNTLTNADVIAVNQDALGEQATIISSPKSGGLQTVMRELILALCCVVLCCHCHHHHHYQHHHQLRRLQKFGKVSRNCHRNIIIITYCTPLTNTLPCALPANASSLTWGGRLTRGNFIALAVNNDISNQTLTIDVGAVLGAGDADAVSCHARVRVRAYRRARV